MTCSLTLGEENTANSVCSWSDVVHSLSADSLELAGFDQASPARWGGVELAEVLSSEDEAFDSDLPDGGPVLETVLFFRFEVVLCGFRRERQRIVFVSVRRRARGGWLTRNVSALDDTTESFDCDQDIVKNLSSTRMAAFSDRASVLGGVRLSGRTLSK